MTYKNVKSYLKAINDLAKHQEVEYMRGFKKLSPHAKDLLYFLIADIQNDIAEINDELKNPKEK